MDINITKAESHQAVILHYSHRLIVSSRQSKGESFHKRENFLPVAKPAASQLADDEGMAGDPASFQELLEMRIALPKVSHPN